jgi:hypothetical protein
MAYFNEEQETVCVYDKIDDAWDVYTCVQKHMTKLFKISVPYWVEKENDRVIAARWKLKSKQIRFAMEIVLSDEQKEARRENARHLHQRS